MKHPLEKIMRIELLAMIVLVIGGLIALIKGYQPVLMFCFYMFALSLFCDGLAAWYTHDTQHAGKQFLKAGMVFVMTTFLLFHL